MGLDCHRSTYARHFTAARKPPTIVDPFQRHSGTVLASKTRKKPVSHSLIFVELKSEFALPRILEQAEGKFDFIFIDGWHTFDHTLLDCLMPPDFCEWGAISRSMMSFSTLCDGWLTFYSIILVTSFFDHWAVKSKSWKRLGARTVLALMPARIQAELFSRRVGRWIFEDTDLRMVVLKKTSEDARDWDWHDDRF